jgi:hypothetical protein
MTVLAHEEQTFEGGNGALGSDGAAGGENGILQHELFAGKFHVGFPFFTKKRIFFKKKE